MKIKTLQLLFVMMTVASSFAQTEKGKFFIGINSNFNFTSTSKKSTATSADGSSFSSVTSPTLNNFTADLKVGYSVIDKLVGGLDISYSFIDAEDPVNRTTTYVISPFVRYYFLENQIKPFINAQFGFGSFDRELGLVTFFDPASQSFTQNIAELNTSIQSLKIGGGVSYFVTKNISLEFILNYINTNYTTTNPFDGNVFEETTTGIRSLFGFSIFI